MSKENLGIYLNMVPSIDYSNYNNIICNGIQMMGKTNASVTYDVHRISGIFDPIPLV